MDTSTTREEEIDRLLLLIAGCESTLRVSQDDLKYSSAIRKIQKGYYEKLRKFVYGLNDE